MTAHEILERLKQEEHQSFTGWDFSFLKDRIREELPPWSYLTRAAELMQHTNAVIDLDTGGGERLLGLREYWPARVVATEGYPPNVQTATERLSPLGVSVVELTLGDHALLPFVDDSFELVLNRHGAFNPAEVSRVLTAGGTFLTQQVDGRSLEDLMAIFNARPQWPNATLDTYVPQLRAAGLTIVRAQEWSCQFEFRDVGAMVYYLKHVPWLVPEFSVTRFADQLLKLHTQQEQGEALVYTTRSYLIEAHK